MIRSLSTLLISLSVLALVVWLSAVDRPGAIFIDPPRLAPVATKGPPPPAGSSHWSRRAEAVA